MRVLRLIADNWVHPQVLWPETRYERWRGLRGLGEEAAMLLATASIHSIGMSRRFRAVGLGADGVVQRIRVVEPGRLVLMPACSHILELPMGVTPPPAGTRLEAHNV